MPSVLFPIHDFLPAILQTFNKIIALSGQFSAAFTRFTGKILRIFAKRKRARARARKLPSPRLMALLKQYQYKNSKIKYSSYKAVQKTELAYYNAVVSINGLTLAQYQKQVSRAKEKYDQAASELGPR
ncbi:Hypothetical protein LBU_0736 [Lactobacillus delbrueckii subsp. bulgaricus 2038]|nr:Hypothetical protein LBU_0736 [Lactobacillus delbrueckii subsp. bulgaricus 2038]